MTPFEELAAGVAEAMQRPAPRVKAAPPEVQLTAPPRARKIVDETELPPHERTKLFYDAIQSRDPDLPSERTRRFAEEI